MTATVIVFLFVFVFCVKCRAGLVFAVMWTLCVVRQTVETTWFLAFYKSSADEARLNCDFLRVAAAWMFELANYLLSLFFSLFFCPCRDFMRCVCVCVCSEPVCLPAREEIAWGVCVYVQYLYVYLPVKRLYEVCVFSICMSACVRLGAWKEVITVRKSQLCVVYDGEVKCLRREIAGNGRSGGLGAIGSGGGRREASWLSDRVLVDRV